MRESRTDSEVATKMLAALTAVELAPGQWVWGVEAHHEVGVLVEGQRLHPTRELALAAGRDWLIHVKGGKS